MADNNSGQSKTHMPTAHRLRQLRRKGQVAKTRDVPAMASVIIAVVLMSMLGSWVIGSLMALMDAAMSPSLMQADSAATLAAWMWLCFREWLALTVPFILVIALTSVLAGFLSTGPVFSLDPVKPDLKKINPVEGLKKMFSVNNAVELVKLIIKLLLLGVVVWFVGRHYLPQLLQVTHATAPALGAVATTVLLASTWAVIAVFMGPTLFDAWFQRWNFKRQNRMTREELKREYRENEGDPHIRGRRRQLHREVNNASMLEAARKSSVVIVNPTHVAIALRYQPGETDLPVVVAKGEGDMAAEIRRIAEEERIPILRDVNLARRMLEHAPLNQYIPDEFIEPVAVVLRWVRDAAMPRPATFMAQTPDSNSAQLSINAEEKRSLSPRGRETERGGEKLQQPIKFSTLSPAPLPSRERGRYAHKSAPSTSGTAASSTGESRSS